MSASAPASVPRGRRNRPSRWKAFSPAPMPLYQAKAAGRRTWRLAV
jgi:hypothetical protein